MRRGMLASRDELVSLRESISRKPFDFIYDKLRKRCAMILEAQPVTEAQWRSVWQQGGWWAALNSARTIQGRVFDLLIAHHIDHNHAYRDRAIEELKGLISWSTWIDPCHNSGAADVCTAEAAVTAVVGLDWLWEDLSEADRLRILQAIRNKALAPYRQGVQNHAFWYDCYHNWNAVVNAGCGLAALALSDEEPLAQQTHHLAVAGLSHFLTALGREGGWDEGTGCWGFALRYLLLLGEATARLLDDRHLLHSRGMDATGLFPIYFTPNGQGASFGESPSVPLYGTFYLLVKHHGLKELAWWLDTYAFTRDVSTSGLSSPGLALLFRPGDTETPKVPDLTPLKVFHEIGWAALADQWPRPELYVAAKTGDLSAHHSQRDMNSIQLQVGGEMLLTDPGGVPSHQFFSDQKQDLYEVQARAHNTLTVGQADHMIDAQGDIIEAQVGKNYRWVACDSGEACGAGIHFIRHIVMIVNPASQCGQAVLVLDELQCRDRVDLYWHTHGRVTVSPKGAFGTITGQQSAINFTIYSSVKGALSVQPQTLAPRNVEQVMRYSFAAAGKCQAASIFSRDKLSGKVEIKRSAGELRVKFDDISVHFKSLRRHLQLDHVVVK